MHRFDGPFRGAVSEPAPSGAPRNRPLQGRSRNRPLQGRPCRNRRLQGRRSEPVPTGAPLGTDSFRGVASSWFVASSSCPFCSSCFTHRDTSSTARSRRFAVVCSCMLYSTLCTPRQGVTACHIGPTPLCARFVSTEIGEVGCSLRSKGGPSAAKMQVSKNRLAFCHTRPAGETTTPSAGSFRSLWPRKRRFDADAPLRIGPAWIPRSR